MNETSLIYAYIWEFHVKEEHRTEFEQVYGPEGEWVQLFKKGNGYLDTKLHRDVSNGKRYLTIDYWKSKADYESFRQRYHKEFNLLDKQCESLTEKEIFLGSFSCMR